MRLQGLFRRETNQLSLENEHRTNSPNQESELVIRNCQKNNLSGAQSPSLTTKRQKESRAEWNRKYENIKQGRRLAGDSWKTNVSCFGHFQLD